jgi:uncharacterized protein (DUF779 family)
MPGIAATQAARKAIAALRAAHGPLMFVQSGGCCDGSSPMCFPAGGFSLDAGEEIHFVARDNLQEES